MESILEKITEWLKELLIAGIMNNLTGMFDSVNEQVAEIAGDVGTTPANFSPEVFTLIQNISFSDSISSSIWSVVGCTVLLCFTLFKSSSIAKAVLNAR